MTHTVDVTLQDINAGIPSSPEMCPIALALKRAYPNRHVSVTPDFVRVEDVDFEPDFNMLDFMAEFDRNGEVAPCKLTMQEYEVRA